MTTWLTPKTDWDSADYYNFNDLNRVENNSQYLSELIGTYATAPSLIGIETGRDNVALVFYDDLNRIENNLNLLKNACFEPPNWITPKTTWISLERFSYTDSNRLENDLVYLKDLIDNIILSLRFCGQNHYQHAGMDFEF